MLQKRLKTAYQDSYFQHHREEVLCLERLAKRKKNSSKAEIKLIIN